MSYLQRIKSAFSKQTLNPNVELKRLLKSDIKSEDAIRNIIEKGANVNATVDTNDTRILMYALKFKASYNIINLLIENGADVHEFDKDIKHTMGYALEYNASIDILKLLIKKITYDTKPEDIDNGFVFTSALSYALLYNASENIIKLLIEKIGDDTEYIDEMDILLYALEYKASDNIIKLLIEKGADVNIINEKNETPLMYALKYKFSINIIKLLIENKADVNAKSDKKITILYFALMYGSSKNVIKLLIKNKVELHIGGIIFAAVLFNTSYNIIKLLIEYDSSMNDTFGNKTLLINALRCKASDKIIKLFIEKGADVNAIDDKGQPILILAIIYKASENVIKSLIQKGANVNVIDYKGRTMLILAIKYKLSENVIKLIIQKGVDVNTKTIKFAIKQDISKEIIQLLTDKKKNSSILQSRSEYNSKYSGNNTLCNKLFEKFKDPLKNKLIFLCNKTNLTEELSLNVFEIKKKFTELKDVSCVFGYERIIQMRKKTELQKINNTFSNNIENFAIKYDNYPAEGGGLTKQFFTNAIEQMFSEYFILIDGTDKFKLKNTTTKEQAYIAGFLVAFSLINGVQFTKQINNIYIAMMIYKIQELKFDDFFLYAMLDQNEDGRKMFQNMCSDSELLEDYCNPETYYNDVIIDIYDLENSNLPTFIQGFNIHIQKRFLRENRINIYDISKILTSVKITKKELILIFDKIKSNKDGRYSDKWLNMYNIFYTLMIDLNLKEYKRLLNKYGTSIQLVELDSMHKFHEKILFFWSSLKTINTNIEPFYDIVNLNKVGYPKAHTCFNQLEIPKYANVEEMFQYFIEALILIKIDRA
jgi:ankyrin repeat protein